MFKNLYWTEWAENPRRGKCVVGSAQGSDTFQIKRALVQCREAWAW